MLLLCSVQGLLLELHYSLCLPPCLISQLFVFYYHHFIYFKEVADVWQEHMDICIVISAVTDSFSSEHWVL